MTKMNIGTWIALIGAGLGMAIGIAAVIVSSEGSGIFIAAIMLTVMGGMFLLFYKIFLGPMLNNSRLQKTGYPGQARILEVRDTGVTINNSPQIKLVVEIKNSLGQKYNTTIKTLVSRINPFAYQPGMEVPVKIDPKNEKNVVLDFGNTQQTAASSSNNQPNETLLKSELEQLQTEHDPIRMSGRPARAIIKKYTWLGAYVNGNNPFVELELEVLPDSSPAFSGKTKGVIAEASVSKFQPGCEIFVKYDYYDNSKVVIDHS